MRGWRCSPREAVGYDEVTHTRSHIRLPDTSLVPEAVQVGVKQLRSSSACPGCRGVVVVHSEETYSRRNSGHLEYTCVTLLRGPASSFTLWLTTVNKLGHHLSLPEVVKKPRPVSLQFDPLA